MDASAIRELPPVDGVYLVLAGPGTGKTTLLAERARQYLQRSTERRKVVALTFTNKAATEMRTRLSALIPDLDAKAFIGTFHSFAGHILRSHGHTIGLDRNFVIYDDREQAAVLTQLQEDRSISVGLDVDNLVFAFGKLKSRTSDPDTPVEGASPQLLNLLALYRQAMREASALDFGDLIIETIRLFKSKPAIRDMYQVAYQSVLVDEFQDTTPAQYELLRLILSPSAPSVFAVADEDQLIFEWNEARMETINRLTEDLGARVVFYTLSHRCPQNIVEAANAVIRHNRLRFPDKPRIESQIEAAYPIELCAAVDEEQEREYVVRTIKSLRADGWRARDIAVIARARRILDPMEQALRLGGVPAASPSIAGLGASEEAAAVLRLLRWLQNARDEQSGRHVIRFIQPRLLPVYEDAIKKSRGHAVEPQSVVETEGDQSHQGLEAFLESVQRWRRLVGDVRALLSELRREIPAIVDDLSDESRSEVFRVFDELEALRQTISARMRLSVPEFLLALPQSVASKDTPGLGHDGAVSLLTYHQAKGLEFRAVFLVALEEGVFPDFRSKGDQRRLEEERRLFYVGITRTKSRLHLSYSRLRKTAKGVPWPREASPFVSEIPDPLIRKVPEL